MEDYFKVEKGQITFDAEGSEQPGLYFSRKPHVPGRYSGITIGRGYDMGARTSASVKKDLINCGVPEKTADFLSRGAGIKGDDAKKFMRENEFSECTITPTQQKRLFEQIYQEYDCEAKRLATKSDVCSRYGDCHWETLHPAIKDIIIDLRYRGDYTPTSRQQIQTIIVSNNLADFAAVMNNAEFWKGKMGVPKNRFDERIRFLVDALELEKDEPPEENYALHKKGQV